MTLPSAPPAAFTSRAFIWPLMAITATIGGVFFGMTALQDTAGGSQSVTTQAPAVSDVEFLSASPAPNLREALQATCAMSGCDASLIGTLVTSAADGMTAADLRAALDVQVVQMDRLLAEAKMSEGTSAAMLRLQWSAEAQIADLYHVELGRRQRVN